MRIWMMKSPSDILRQAADMIEIRGKQYGDYNKSFEINAKGLGLVIDKEVKPFQSPLILAITKLTRLFHDPKNRDSWIDLLAYIAIAACMALKNKGDA